MDITTNNSYKLNNLGKINVILGKNGSGKSNLLRDINQPHTLARNSDLGKVKYVTPERGGVLRSDTNTEQNMNSNSEWIIETRRRNQFEKFREQSVTQFKNLELMILRIVDREKRLDNTFSFDNLVLTKINKLLDQIEIRNEGVMFTIYKKGTDIKLDPSIISSGESELISLGIEILNFQYEVSDSKLNILCLDEPDVHLHPDLQVRLMEFIEEITKNNSHIIVILATHSTALLGALDEYSDVKIAFKINEINDLIFQSVTEAYKKILPVFGAHPLSNIFNQLPILIVEGESDELVWQHAVRSSNNRIKLYPCSAGNIDSMNIYEKDADKIIQAVYESAKGYSLRDGDENIGKSIDPEGKIIRYRLHCKSIENLLLSNEVLQNLDTDWNNLKNKILVWLGDEKNRSHSKYEFIKEFSIEFNRETFDIKPFREVIIYLIEKNIPWEKAIGKTIGNLPVPEDLDFTQEGSIYKMLGMDLIREFIK